MNEIKRNTTPKKVNKVLVVLFLMKSFEEKVIIVIDRVKYNPTFLRFVWYIFVAVPPIV
tara:strand:+ start:1643 stop:1819 length:177 start_codon:yes stop_codon:yes gene_type:complete